MRDTATATPTGTISSAATPSFATAKRIRAPATLFVRRFEVGSVVGDERVVHRRRYGARIGQMLPAQRTDLLAAVLGRRQKATARRCCSPGRSPTAPTPA